MEQAKNRRKKQSRKAKPTDRQLAALALSFFFNSSTDEQIGLLLKKTIRDWIDWLYHVPNKRLADATLPSRRVK